jgi:hypothetical protein
MNLADINPRLRARIEDALGAGATIAAQSAAAGGIPGMADVKQPRPSPESDLHDKVVDYCRAKGWFVVHSRMDRRSTIGVGTPDFAIAAHGGRMLWLELKRKGGKPTIAQQAAIAQLTKLGHLAFVVDNWSDALRLLEGLGQ